jgi:hypothetical protein
VFTQNLNSEKMLQRLENVGVSADEVKAFATALSQARSYSVDTFLEMRPEFLAVGKAVTADVLLRREQYVL